MTSRLCLDGELSLGESDSVLSSLGGLGLLLFLGQLSSDGSGLLGAHVLGCVLFGGVQGLDRITLVQVDDGENSGDVLSDSVDSGQRGLLNLLHLQVGQLLLQLDQLLLQFLFGLGSQFKSFSASHFELCLRLIDFEIDR